MKALVQNDKISIGSKYKWTIEQRRFDYNVHKEEKGNHC